MERGSVHSSRVNRDRAVRLGELRGAVSCGGQWGVLCWGIAFAFDSSCSGCPARRRSRAARHIRVASGKLIGWPSSPRFAQAIWVLPQSIWIRCSLPYEVVLRWAWLGPRNDHLPRRWLIPFPVAFSAPPSWILVSRPIMAGARNGRPG